MSNNRYGFSEWARLLRPPQLASAAFRLALALLVSVSAWATSGLHAGPVLAAGEDLRVRAVTDGESTTHGAARSFLLRYDATKSDLAQPYSRRDLGKIAPELDLDTARELLGFSRRVRDEKQIPEAGLDLLIEEWERIVAGWPKSYETLKAAEEERKAQEETRLKGQRDKSGFGGPSFTAKYVGGYKSVQAGKAAHVSGVIASDTTWTQSGSPYVVDADVTVSDGVTLIVEAGSVVQFEAEVGLYVEGTLQALGTEASPILFTSNQDNPAGADWETIHFGDSSQNAVYDDNRVGGRLHSASLHD